MPCATNQSCSKGSAASTWSTSRRILPIRQLAQAHQQMVSTGQLKQTGCPFSGGPVKAGTQLTIGDAEVGFCCNNCKGKVEKAAPAEQVNLVFGDISKGFAPAK